MSIQTAVIICIITLLGFASNTLHAQQSEPEKTPATKPETNSANKPVKKNQENDRGIVMPTPQIKQQKQDLNHYLAKEKISPILAGPDDYLTIVNRYTSANSKGVAVLLPDWQQGATNPKAMQFLQETLPAHGWTTITVQPENKPENYPSTAIEVTQQTEEDETTIQAYKAKLSSMLNALMSKAKENPGVVLVIAQGNHAAMFVDLVDQEQSEAANALIVLSGFLDANKSQQAKINDSFAQQLAQTEYPVFDVLLKYDHPLVAASAKKRLIYSQQEMKVYYRQRQLNNTSTGYYPEKELIRQINSWLRSIGW